MRGEVVYMYAYDVAYEIDLPKVRDFVRHRVQYLEVKPDKTLPRDLTFHKPLLVREHALAVKTALGEMKLRREIKVFAVGALSISIRAAFEAESLKDLLAFHSLEIEGGRSVDEIAGGIAEQFLNSIRPFLIKPAAAMGNPEAYTVFCLYDLGLPSRPVARQWLDANRREVAGLLTEEANFLALSDDEVEETIHRTYCYTAQDLIAIDWNSALIVDPDAKPEDLLYTIEAANLQLTEYRLYDRILEKGVDQAYADFDAFTRKPPVLRSPSEILHRLRAMRMDLEKMSDEVTNITKFFGDWHLARIYMGCADRFHLKDWQMSVDGKLRTLDNLYNLVLNEINNRRMLWLEAAIVGLFVGDIVLILLKAK
jgi:hypothetical protein